MPKTNNKGFGGLPVLILMLSLSVLSFVGYQYYSSLNKLVDTAIEEVNSEDVLQATSNSVPKDLNNFFFRYFLNSENLSEYNRGTEATILSTSKEFKNCIFSQRSSKPINVYYTLAGRNYSAKIFQNVKLQTLPDYTYEENYAVIIPSVNAAISFNTNSGIIKSNCGPTQGIFILQQPSTPITQASFNSLVTEDKVMIPEIKAEILITPEKNNQTFLTVTPTGDEKANLLVNDLFKKKGIMVRLDNKKTLIIKETSCVLGGCAKGFKMRIPATPLYIKSSIQMTEILLPSISKDTEYDIRAEGQPCDQPQQLFVYKNFVITFNFGGICPIGMNYQK